jgi:hypothetical protein
MRSLIIHIREACFAFAANSLWGGWLPVALRARLLRAVMARNSRAGGVSRQLSLLASAIARAGARRLARSPQGAARLICRAGASGARALVIAGDSHSKLYVHRVAAGAEWVLPLHYLATAASARGLGRADSRSGQGAAISRLLAGARDAGLRLPVVLVFGQVDIEFVHMFKRLASDPPAPLDEQALVSFSRETVAAYVEFGARLASDFDVDLYLATILPPALSDAAWKQGYVNANIAGNHTSIAQATIREKLGSTEIATLAERTRDHQAFNEILRTAATAAGLRVLDLASSLPMKDGAVSADMLGPAAGTDHHLDGEALQPFVTPRLMAIARTSAD